eukprot:3911473-Amphidinium_carterae.1
MGFTLSADLIQLMRLFAVSFSHGCRGHCLIRLRSLFSSATGLNAGDSHAMWTIGTNFLSLCEMLPFLVKSVLVSLPFARLMSCLLYTSPSPRDRG